MRVSDATVGLGAADGRVFGPEAGVLQMLVWVFGATDCCRWAEEYLENRSYC
jgi:hypothetical protein